MFGKYSEKLRKTLMLLSHINSFDLMRRAIYLWEEFGIQVNIKAIVSHFEVKITHKNKDILPLVKIKNLKTVYRITNIFMRKMEITKEDIEKEDKSNDG